MASDIGRNRNTNTEASSTSVTLNATTATIIRPAKVDRIFFGIYNPTNRDIFLKLQATTVDDNPIGIVVLRNSEWEMPSDNIYTGEISAIAALDNPIVQVVEY